LSYTFSAKERDPETGLSYFGSRYYSSDLSIWLSVDPQAAKYPSLSPYVYCADNPVRLVDPNGEEMLDPWYQDAVGFVRWIDSEFEMPKSGTFLGNEGVFTSNGEMRYYYADGLISNLKLPQVFIDGGGSKDYAFPFSSAPLQCAGIGNPSEQVGSFSCNFQFNTSNVDVGLITNYVGVTSSICADNNVGLKYIIPQGISSVAYGVQMVDIGIDTYRNWPPSVENYYDLTTTNIGFWGGPMGAMIGFTLDMYKRGAKWIANYFSELEMELRRMNSPQTYY
jgi:RHS repeat-associated protein